jgi:hypothetical protein
MENRILAQPVQFGPVQPRAHARPRGQAAPACRCRALSLPLPSGADLSAPVAFARAPVFSLCLAGPTRQRAEPFPLRAYFLSLRCGASLSAPPSLRATVDQRARMQRTATSPAHAPQLPFKHHPHPLSLPCLISRQLTPSRALPSTLVLSGGPHLSCWPSSPPEAAPSHPELHPEMRNLFLCLVFLIRA